MLLSHLVSKSYIVAAVGGVFSSRGLAGTVPTNLKSTSLMEKAGLRVHRGP